MCGRMNISDHAGIQWLLDQLGLSIPPAHFTARHNVPPVSAIWSVSRSNQGPIVAPSQWGFIPPWAREGQFKRPLTVARAETIHEKPSFRSLIARYRGIIPVNGFYEWKRSGDRKIPYHISAETPALAIASICQMHGDGYQQCCVVTTESSGSMKSIHKRQPVIIAADSLDQWLNDDRPASVAKLLQSSHHQALLTRQVSSYVNDSRNDGPACLHAATTSGEN